MLLFGLCKRLFRSTQEEPLPDLEEKQFLLDKMDEETRRKAHLVEEYKRVDAEITAEEKPPATDTDATPSIAQPTACLPYTPNVVTLIGTLTERTPFAATDDGPTDNWVLTLAKPICTFQGADAMHKPTHDVLIVQVVFVTEEQYDQYRSLVNVTVKVTGVLFSGETSPHPMAVMMQPSRIETYLPDTVPKLPPQPSPYVYSVDEPRLPPSGSRFVSFGQTSG